MLLEIWKEISLLLPYNFLSLSKQLQTIYDEKWFERKIKITHPNCITQNYQSAYKRLLQSGRFFRYYFDRACDMKVEAYDFTDYNQKDYLLLSFDGNLYTYDIKGNLVLLDNNVTMVGKKCCVKNNHEWYRTEEINHITKSYLITTSEIPFLSCSFSHRQYFSITNKQIYQYHQDNLIITNFDGINKIIYIGEIIIQSNDELYRYNKRNQKLFKLDIPPVKEVFRNCAKLIDGSIVYFCYEYDRFGKEFYTKIIRTSNNDLRGSFSSYNDFFILLENVLYKVGNDKLVLIKDNVKSIKNGYYMIY